MMIDANNYKNSLCDYLSQQSNKFFTINSLKLKAFPTIELEITDLHVKNNKTSKNTLVNIKKLSITPRLIPLFIGNLGIYLCGNEIQWKQYHIHTLKSKISFRQNFIEFVNTEAFLNNDAKNKSFNVDLFKITNINNEMFYLIKHQSTNFDLLMLFDFLKSKFKIASIAKIELELTSNGKTLLDIKKNLLGSFNMKAAQGNFHGIDLINSLKDAKSVLKTITSNLGLTIAEAFNNLVHKEQVQNQTKTPFHEIILSAKIKNGKIETNNISINHSYYQVKGNGLINLIKNTLNYNLETEYYGSHITRTKVKHKSQINKRATPLKLLITGPIENPNIKADFSSYLQYIKN